MNETKHTPGPWTLEGRKKRGRYFIKHDGEGCGVVAEIFASPENAQAMTASPSLLDSCQELIALLEKHQGEAPWYQAKHYNHAAFAIGKALGYEYVYEED